MFFDFLDSGGCFSFGVVSSCVDESFNDSLILVNFDNLQSLDSHETHWKGTSATNAHALI